MEGATGGFGAAAKLDVEPTIDMKTLHAKIAELRVSRQAILLEIRTSMDGKGTWLNEYLR